MAHQNNDYMVKLADSNPIDGVLREPRGFYDTLVITSDGLPVAGNPDVFQNGEQFPVVITHLTMAVRLQDALNAVADERLIQRFGLRIAYHDQWYMSRQFPVCPLWQNVVVAGPDNMTQSSAVWTFPKPVILSARDTIQVRVALEAAPVQSRRVSVSFTGVGMLSRRPYFLQGELDLTDANVTTLPTQNFRNDGTEPIELQTMVVYCGAEDDANNPMGDIRRCRVQIRQAGNGTGANWFVGPLGAAALAECPAVNLGITSGRCIVHKIPGDGWIWEPGEGVTVDALAVNNGTGLTNDTTLVLGMFGYIAVQ